MLTAVMMPFSIFGFGMSNLSFFFYQIPPIAVMAPPVYADLGKSSRDVFGKGYHFSLLKLECKTKTSNGVEFTTGGSSNLDSGKVVGNLETKYKIAEYGMN